MDSWDHTGWIGVDLDGTLAVYDGWKGQEHIGAPIPAMVDRVKTWITQGRDVRIVTARVHPECSDHLTRGYIQAWCKEHLGRALQITHQKDMNMLELWDDRAVAVEKNTGRYKRWTGEGKDYD